MAPTIAQTKKTQMTLAQLSSYDDIITDALVDHVYFWTQIRKIREKYVACRGVREEEITGILRECAIIDKNPQVAEAGLMAVPGIAKFVGRLKTEQEREDFRRHLRKYLNMYLPECSFEITTTNRFTISSHEAAVSARRAIKAGETIKYLAGVQVILTREDEQELERKKGDFSIVVSSRKQAASIFLGPARFANHDCNPNARLVPVGAHGMQVVAKRGIAVGEEITVSYAAGYFGRDNCECLCRTCEGEERNGWAAPSSSSSRGAGAGEPSATAEAGVAPYRLRIRRKYPTDPGQPPEREPKRRKTTDDHQERAISVAEQEAPSGSETLALVKWEAPISDWNLAMMESRKRKSVEEPASKEERPPKKRMTLEEVSMYHQRLDPTMPRPLTPNATSALRSTLSPVWTAGAVGRRLSTQSAASRLEFMSAASPPVSTFTEISQRSPYETEATSLLESGHDTDQRRPSTAGHTPHPLSISRSLTPVNSWTRLNQATMPAGGNQNTEQRRPLTAGHTPHPLSISRSLSPVNPWTYLNETMVPAGDSQAVTVANSRIASPGPDIPNAPTPSHLSNDDGILSDLSDIDDDVLQDMSRTFESRKPHEIAREVKKQQRQRGKKSEIPRPRPSTGRAASSTAPSQQQSHMASTTTARRRPRDYVLTRSLLSEPSSAWVTCTICNSAFVQANAYCIRAACPRCERHSKLYGYKWPKTDKEGRNDPEERVMDHRTVHRFIHPEQEREARKGKYRGIERAESSQPSKQEEQEENDDDDAEQSDAKKAVGPNPDDDVPARSTRSATRKRAQTGRPTGRVGKVGQPSGRARGGESCGSSTRGATESSTTRGGGVSTGTSTRGSAGGRGKGQASQREASTAASTTSGRGGPRGRPRGRARNEQLLEGHTIF